MSHIATTRRAATGVGAAALLGLALGAPALADPLVPGQGAPAYEVPAGPPSYNSFPNGGANDSQTGSADPASTLGSDSVEYLQIALGALGGVALTAGVVAVAASGRQRRHHTAHA